MSLLLRPYHCHLDLTSVTYSLSCHIGTVLTSSLALGNIFFALFISNHFQKFADVIVRCLRDDRILHCEYVPVHSGILFPIKLANTLKSVCNKISLLSFLNFCKTIFPIVFLHLFKTKQPRILHD